MAQEFSMDAAKQVLEGGMAKAEALLADPAEVNALLDDIKTKLAGLPASAGEALTQIPLLAEMVKSYITREYSEVSPKVIATVVAALLYLVKGKDIIPDNIPIVGIVDDVAVVALAVSINKAELDAFQAWKDSRIA